MAERSNSSRKKREKIKNKSHAFMAIIFLWKSYKKYRLTFEYFFLITQKCKIAVSLHLGKPAFTDYLACDACLLWQAYYVWNSGRTHRRDKRPPYSWFKPEYKKKKAEWKKNTVNQKILNNQMKKWSLCAFSAIIFHWKVIKEVTEIWLFLATT